MTLKKRTLRRMSPLQRDVGKLLNELDSVRRKLRNKLEKIGDLETYARAYLKGTPQPSGLGRAMTKEETDQEIKRLFG